MSTLSMINKSAKLAALTFLTIATVTQAGWETGSQIPDLKTFNLEGTIPADSKGKVILLDFWASWCSPCKASFPILADLQNEYGAKEFLILAINVDNTSDLMKAFLKEHPASFVVLRDQNHKLVQAADVQSMPSSFLIDHSGKIRFRHTGFHGAKTTAQYKQEIELLIQEKDAVKP